MSVSVKKWGFVTWGKAIIHGENTPEFPGIDTGVESCEE